MAAIFGSMPRHLRCRAWHRTPAHPARPRRSWRPGCRPRRAHHPARSSGPDRGEAGTDTRRRLPGRCGLRGRCDDDGKERGPALRPGGRPSLIGTSSPAHRRGRLRGPLPGSARSRGPSGRRQVAAAAAILASSRPIDSPAPSRRFRRRRRRAADRRRPTTPPNCPMTASTSGRSRRFHVAPHRARRRAPLPFHAGIPQAATMSHPPDAARGPARTALVTDLAEDALQVRQRVHQQRQADAGEAFPHVHDPSSESGLPIGVW